MKTYWAGFVDGKISVEERPMLVTFDDYSITPIHRYHPSPYIFTSRKDAKLYFDDVRKVEIREVK